MSEKSCLNCHFLCISGIDNNNRPVQQPFETEARTRKRLIERLEDQARCPQFPSSIACFCGNWDSTKIGKENTAEISNAIFSRKRKKCAHFVVYDKHAAPEAVRNREDMKREIIDQKVTRRIAVMALAVSFAALVVSIIADLQEILRLFICKELLP
jgi:hypothetical protein